MAVSSKERILTKVRKALIKPTPQPYPGVEPTTASLYPTPDDSLEMIFAQEFKKIQGEFVFCENESEFVKNLSQLADFKGWNHLFCWEPGLQQLFVKHDFRKCRIGKNIEKADAGITNCEALIARTGSVLLSSRQASGRTLSIYPPVHIVVAKTEQLVFDIEEGLKLLKERYNGNLPSMINLATGPSRTADIEKTLVLGAHGPKEVYVFLIDN